MSQCSTGLSRNERQHIPFADRITCTVSEACQVSGLGRTKLYQAMSEGRLKFVKFDKRRLIHIPSLLKLLEAA